MSQRTNVRIVLKNGTVLIVTPDANPRVTGWFLSAKQ